MGTILGSLLLGTQVCDLICLALCLSLSVSERQKHDFLVFVSLFCYATAVSECAVLQ
jgi:hypothetical protein